VHFRIDKSYAAEDSELQASKAPLEK